MTGADRIIRWSTAGEVDGVAVWRLAVLALAAMEGSATRTPAASHADGSRRSILGAEAIDPVAVAPRWLNWRHPASGVGRGNILQFAGR
jgi:hypothetical protein